jgi:hypothetical protein
MEKEKYKEKYNKYKNKYIRLKEQKAGMEMTTVEYKDKLYKENNKMEKITGEENIEENIIEEEERKCGIRK